MSGNLKRIKELIDASLSSKHLPYNYVKKKEQIGHDLLFLVPWVGIEPTLPKELDFESSASTNSATKASMVIRVQIYKIISIYNTFSKKN